MPTNGLQSCLEIISSGLITMIFTLIIDLCSLKEPPAADNREVASLVGGVSLLFKNTQVKVLLPSLCLLLSCM